MEAVYKDIHRCHQEGELGEVIQIVNEIDTILGKIDEWAKPQVTRTEMPSDETLHDSMQFFVIRKLVQSIQTLK